MKKWGLIFVLGCVFLLMLTSCGRLFDQTSDPSADKIDSDVIALYQGFLNGETAAIDKGGVDKNLNDYLQTANYTYCFSDLTNDGAPELCIREQQLLIYTAKNDHIYFCSSESIYCTVLNNGHLLYKRHGSAPTHISYEYYAFDNEAKRKTVITFSQWDSTHLNGQIYPELHLVNDKEVSKEAYESQTAAYRNVGSDTVIWYTADGKEQNNSKNQRKLLLQILMGEETFIDEQGREISLVEYAPPGVRDIVLLNPTEYTFVDLDGDGAEELITNVSEDYGLYMFFRRKDDRTYGYALSIRSFNNLKADGRFTQSSSAFDTSVAKITFNVTDLQIEIVASSDKQKEEYTIGGKAVSKVEADTYFREFDKTTAPIWETISYRVISLYEQLEKKIDGTFQKKYQDTVDESEMRELRHAYTEQWKQIADEYYQKALNRIQIAEEDDPSYDTDALRQHIANLKQNWEKYYQSEMKAFENFYATLYSGGSLTGTVSEHHEYTLCKNWALEIVSIYESLI